MGSTYLTASALSKTYRGSLGKPDVHALQDLTLAVEGGEIFGLLGPNGAGKTTFIKLILGLAKPTSGSATLMGSSVLDWRARRQVGYLPENHRFPEFLSARQMLLLYAQLSGLDVGRTQTKIDEMMDLVGMRTWADVRIKKYSKGMLQRVGLAQALLGDPALIFLDEPTDGVDPIGRRDIRNVLLHLRDLGKTVFINSHLLSELEMVCSRVAIIDHGVLVREGTLADLLEESGKYRLLSTAIPPAIMAASTVIQHLPSGAAADSTREGQLCSYVLTVQSRKELNELLDLLRSAGVEIESIVHPRDSLEELFVRSVGDDGADSLRSQQEASHQARDPE